MDKWWLPGFKDYNILKQDLLKQCKIDAMRGIKTDSRSSEEAKAFVTLEKESEENAIPYN